MELKKIDFDNFIVIYHDKMKQNKIILSIKVLKLSQIEVFCISIIRETFNKCFIRLIIKNVYLLESFLFRTVNGSF
jgi:hypothetical protein